MVGFGPVQADFTEGKLLKPGAPEIQSEPLGVLLLLVQRHGEIVSSYDFRRALWRDDIFVDRPPTIRAAARLFLR